MHPRSPKYAGALKARRGRSKCGGIVLILMLTVIVLIASTVAVSLVGSEAPRLRNERSTEDALAIAKEGLIAYAASDDNRPGELPCPDTNNNGRVDVGVDTAGANCTQLVGRLPWFTLGLPDLRDGSGERLWYALSDNFHAGDTAKLNSDTPGQLSVTGSVPAAYVVAVVFAPGPVLSTVGQDRSSTANQNQAANYLEGTNATSATNFVAASASTTFNDRLLAIRPEEIFHPIEKRVARELRPLISKYLSDWGRYPFPGTWSQPATQADFKGAAGSAEGLLPVTGDSSFVSWGPGTITASASGGGVCVVNAGNLECTYEAAGSATPPWWCVFFPWLCPSGPGTLPANTEIIVTASATNAGLMFVDPPVINQPVSPMNIATNAGGTLNAQNLVLGLDSSGAGTIQFSGRTPASTTTASVVIPKPVPSAWLGTSWITGNDWHEVTYYAISPGYAPGGPGSCVLPANPCGSPPPAPVANQCLSICNATAGTAVSNAKAVVTMTGPETTGQDRSSPALANYLEAGNLSTPDFVFERRVREPGFNDQPVEIETLP